MEKVFYSKQGQLDKRDWLKIALFSFGGGALSAVIQILTEISQTSNFMLDRKFVISTIAATLSGGLISMGRSLFTPDQKIVRKIKPPKKDNLPPAYVAPPIDTSTEDNEAKN